MTAATYKSSNRGFILIVVAIIAAGLLLVAYLAANRDSIPEWVLEADATASITADGESLAPMPPTVRVTMDAATDSAIGTVAPDLNGTGFDGEDITITADGQPKVVYFLAHWCRHCQDEVPAIQELIDAGDVPEGLDLYAVSTSVSEERGNYPPATWLWREGFEPPTLRDDDASSALRAYGAGGFPFAVYLDGDNQVVARSTGELGKDGIAELWELTAQGLGQPSSPG